MSQLQTVEPANLLDRSEPASIGLPLVLVADADAGSRTRRTRQLEGRGFRVAVSRTVFETIVKASCHLPDLILVGAQGYQLLPHALGDSDDWPSVPKDRAIGIAVAHPFAFLRGHGSACRDQRCKNCEQMAQNTHG